MLKTWKNKKTEVVLRRSWKSGNGKA